MKEYATAITKAPSTAIHHVMLGKRRSTAAPIMAAIAKGYKCLDEYITWAPSSGGIGSMFVIEKRTLIKTNFEINASGRKTKYLKTMAAARFARGPATATLPLSK